MAEPSTDAPAANPGARAPSCGALVPSLVTSALPGEVSWPGQTLAVLLSTGAFTVVASWERLVTSRLQQLDRVCPAALSV